MELRYNTVEYDICKTQAKLFRYAARIGIDMEWFTNFFMRSKFCNREMDSKYSFYQIGLPAELLEILEVEADNNNIPIRYHENKYFDEDIAEFIGFTYRHLHFYSGLSSSKLVDKIPLQTLCNSYAGLHTLDENAAIEILCKELHVKEDINKNSAPEKNIR